MIIPPNRVAVVTGANKGIGYFIALQLGMSGLFSNIILGCRDIQRGESAVQLLQAQIQDKVEAQFQSISLTVGDSDSHSAFTRRMDDEFAGKVDVLVNNAGLYTEPNEREFRILETNYFGLVDLTEKMLPLLRKGTDARIVNVSSMLGRLSIVSRDLQSKFSDKTLTIEGLSGLMNQYKSDVVGGKHRSKGWPSSNYDVSKLGVFAATMVWARREAAVSINVCCPGWCNTDMSSGPRPAKDGARNVIIPATIKNPPTGSIYSD